MRVEFAVGQLWQAPAEARCTSRWIVRIVEVEGAKLIAFRRREASNLEYVRPEKFLLWAHRSGAQLVQECESFGSETIEEVALAPV